MSAKIKKAKPHVGRPAKPENERARIVSTRLPAEAIPFLEAYGDGKVTAGLKRVVLEAMERAGKNNS